VRELLLAGPDELVDRAASQAQACLSFLGALMLATIGRFRVALLAADQHGAHQRCGREETEGHDGRPDDRGVPPRPRAQPLRDRRRAGNDGPAIEEPLQVVGHFLRRRVAVSRVFADCLENDGFQFRGDRRLHGTRGGRLVVGDLPDQGVAVAATEGGAEGEQLVERGAERIDIAAVIDDPASGEDLLGAGVAQRAEHLAGDREPSIARDLGQPKVGDPELPAQVQQQISRLDVAMHDSRLVGVLERQRRLAAQAGRPVDVPPAVRGPLARDCRRRGC
jgi:hypothetical protein